MENRTLGLGLLAVVLPVLAYYVMWTAVLVSACARVPVAPWALTHRLQPFVDEGHALRGFFPDPYIGVALPALLAYTVFSATLGYVALIIVQS